MSRGLGELVCLAVMWNAFKTNFFQSSNGSLPVSMLLNVFFAYCPHILLGIQVWRIIGPWPLHCDLCSNHCCSCRKTMQQFFTIQDNVVRLLGWESLLQPRANFFLDDVSLQLTSERGWHQHIQMLSIRSCEPKHLLLLHFLPISFWEPLLWPLKGRKFLLCLGHVGVGGLRLVDIQAGAGWADSGHGSKKICSRTPTALSQSLTLFERHAELA